MFTSIDIHILTDHSTLLSKVLSCSIGIEAAGFLLSPFEFFDTDLANIRLLKSNTCKWNEQNWHAAEKKKVPGWIWLRCSVYKIYEEKTKWTDPFTSTMQFEFWTHILFSTDVNLVITHVFKHATRIQLINTNCCAAIASLNDLSKESTFIADIVFNNRNSLEIQIVLQLFRNEYSVFAKDRKFIWKLRQSLYAFLKSMKQSLAKISYLNRKWCLAERQNAFKIIIDTRNWFIKRLTTNSRTDRSDYNIQRKNFKFMHKYTPSRPFQQIHSLEECTRWGEWLNKVEIRCSTWNRKWKRLQLFLELCLYQCSLEKLAQNTTRNSVNFSKYVWHDT